MHDLSEKIRRTASGTAHLITPWTYALYQSLLPVLVATVITAILLRLGQVEEVLYGTIDLQSSSIQMLWFAFSVFIFSATIWYTSRLLVTIDAGLQMPLNLRSGLLLSDVQRAIVHLPRILGALSAALLGSVFIHAQQSWGMRNLLTTLMPWASTLLPLLIVMLTKPWSLRSAGACMVWLLVLFLPMFMVMSCLPDRFNIPVLSSLLLMTYLPILLYKATVNRRPLLRKLNIIVPEANETLLFEHAVRRLAGLFIAAVMLFLFLVFGAESLTSSIGSAAIVMLFCSSSLLLLCALTLCFRRLGYHVPGFALTGSLVLLAVYFVLHAQFGWSPFKEVPGEEVLMAKSETLILPQVQPAKEQDIIVNAYGGGIRAALFTATLLARVDDMSCGEFGQKLDRLSGVSGGSVGIAVYATLRQEYVASGGWPADCRRHLPRLAHLELLIDDVLIQDHLSPVLARMLSIDLLPGIVPQRGQALLNSWQDATQKALGNLKAQQGPGGSNAISLFALARPITSLTAGVAPAPKIYFNSTESASGQRLWLSNTGNWGDGAGRQGKLVSQFQVGMAALHSARFPLVSPSGSFPQSDGTYKLVDGGYADNSGAETLRTTGSQAGDASKHWINIDGNPPAVDCPTLEKAKTAEVWSGLNALFAVREAQAGLAVSRLKTTLEDIHVNIDLNKAFSHSISDADHRCEFIHRLRSAPLGWYLTKKSAGDMHIAISEQANWICEKLKPLCVAK